jgi:hypothetical protein
MGLNVAIPGSCLMANVIEFRNRPGRISRVFRPGHRWTVERSRASALSQRFGKFSARDKGHELDPSAFQPNIDCLYRSI